MIRRLFTISAAAAALFVACSAPYGTPEEASYYIDEDGICLFRASVEPLSGSWIWHSASDRIGVYAANRDNAAFFPRQQFDGTSGEAEVFGPAASGQAYAYLPYSEAGYESAKYGCVILPSEQRYCEGALAQILENTQVVVACAEDGNRLVFRNHCGAMRLSVKINFTENLKTLTLSANEPVCGWLDVSGNAQMRYPSRSVTVTGIDKPCTEVDPATVWIMLPQGSYSGVYITASGETESISTIVPGTFDILSGQECSATAMEEKNNYGGSDFEAEEVRYDD